MEASSRGEVTDAWGGWVATHWQWDWFFTGTFAPIDEEDRPTKVHNRVGWQGSDRAFRRWVEHLRERAPVPGPYWLRAREPHQIRRSTHFHALVGGVGKLSRREAFSEWKNANGQCRIEPIPAEQGRRDRIALYVAKYVLKDGGELVFSENAGLFRGSCDDEQCNCR